MKSGGTVERNRAFIAALVCLVMASGMSCNSSPSPAAPSTGKTAIKTVASAGTNPRPLPPPTAPKPLYQPPDLSHWKCHWQEIERGAPESKEVALTFDADWSARYTIPIINALKARHYRATFFITGQFCRNFPKETLALAQSGMEIGSHSDTHPRFAKLDDKSIQRQLDNSDASFRACFGRSVKPLFRFPYGESDKRSRMTVAAAGFQPIYWSLDSLDSFGKEKSAEFVTKRILLRIKAGDIVLMHVSAKGSAEALPGILSVLNKRGLKVVPVSEFMKSG